MHKNVVFNMIFSIKYNFHSKVNLTVIISNWNNDNLYDLYLGGEKLSISKLLNPLVEDF